jgi:Flp pilus assembly protein TadD
VLARINFRQNAFEDAAQLLRELAARRPLAADESFALGVSLAETGHPDEARGPREQALAAGLAEPDAARATAVLKGLRGE